MTVELTCREVIGLLADYLEQTLSARALEDFERHLDHCPPCIAYLRTYQKTRELTGEAMRVAMPEDMQSRLRQFLIEQLRRR
jgi:anti-sigma factor RsiW